MMPSKNFLLSILLLLSSTVMASNHTLASDSIKYRGYRLELTDFKLLKEKGDWVKISCTIVNSGRMNVDLSKKGTDHWVVFNFDQSVFDSKLGGYRNNIKRQLVENQFKLEAGKMVVDKELKIPSVIPTNIQPKTEEPIVAKNTDELSKSSNQKHSGSLSWEFSEPRSYPEVEMTEKGPIQEEMVAKVEEPEVEKNICADIYFSDVKVIDQNDRWATIQYTVTNQGDGTFYLFGKKEGKNDNLYVNAYLSGVTTLTRGALPIGGKVITKETRSKNELNKGESLKGQIKLDIRKKTRYMKSLILSLESHQFARECDRKNNSQGIVLE